MIGLTRHAVAHPIAWLVALAAVTGVLALGVLRLELRTEGETLRPEGAAAVQQTAADRLRFEEPRRALLLVTCRRGDPCLATPAGFRFLRSLDTALRQLSPVRGNHVVSLASLTRIEKTGDRLAVGRWLDDIPDDPAAFAALLAAVRREPVTSGLLLSPDGTAASLDVPLAEDRPVPELVAELEAWVAERAAPRPELALQLAGPEVAEATLGTAVLHDLALLVPAMLLAIAVLLYATLGMPAGVLVPLLEAGIVLTWTLGAMGWLGAPITLVTTVLPVLLMAMAITDEIHLLERLQRQVPGRDAAGAVVAALESVGRPIVLTSVTTALGFLSFLTASIAPLRDFGLFAAFGILVAMVLTFTGIPALLVRLPAGWLAPQRAPRSGATPRRDLLGHLAVRRSGVGLALAVGAVLVSLPGLWQLRVQDSWVANFAEDAPIATAARTFDRAFWGQYRFDVVVESEAEHFYGPSGARLVRELENAARSAPHVGGTLSYLAPLTSVARALGDETFGGLDAQLGDLATLAELSAHRLALRQLLTDAGDAARVRLFVKGADYERAVVLQQHLDPLVAALSRESGVTAHYSGDLPVAMEVVRAIVRNQLRSIGLTLVLVTFVLSAFFLGPRVGLAAVAPAAAAVVILLGGMGYAGVALGIATSMFASLTVGVGVDFGIHFLHRYAAQRRFGRDHEAALAATVDQVGLALRWNASVLGLGFLVLCLSSLRPNRDLGLLLAAGIAVCFAMTLLALPRLARLTVPAAALAVLLVSGVPSGAVAASADPCSAAPDADAQALMSRIEAKTRGLRRIVHMMLYDHVTDPTQLDPRAHPRPAKPLWGIFDGDPRRTRILYVFGGPGRLAGTTLLIEDDTGSVEADRMWLFLRMFGSFTELDASFRDVFVPGTVLTYEDARAFLPSDKYRFVSGPSGSDPELREVHACPRTEALARELGYHRLRIVVSPARLLVREIEYHDLSDRIVKHYRVTQERRIGRHWLPAEIVLEHRADGTLSLMELEHWLPDEAPPASLYDPSVAREAFLPRLQRYLARLQLDDRLRGELERSEAQAREWDARFEPHR